MSEVGAYREFQVLGPNGLNEMVLADEVRNGGDGALSFWSLNPMKEVRRFEAGEWEWIGWPQPQ